MIPKPAFFILIILIAAIPMEAIESSCSIRQITDANHGDSSSPSIDGQMIAFSSTADLTGDNPGGATEIFIFDGEIISQLTTFGRSSERPDIHEGMVAFSSNALTALNPDGRHEIFLFDGETIRQLTTTTLGVGRPSLHSGSIAFISMDDITGENSGHKTEVFFFDGSSIVQITKSTKIGFTGTTSPSLFRGSIAFASNSDFTGENPDHSGEIFLVENNITKQVTVSPFGFNVRPQLDEGLIAFLSSLDLVGANADGGEQIFLAGSSGLRQITQLEPGPSIFDLSLDSGAIAFVSDADVTGKGLGLVLGVFFFDGREIIEVASFVNSGVRGLDLSEGSIAFSTTADLTGDNPERNFEIFLATCPLAQGPSLEQIPALDWLGRSLFLILLVSSALLMLYRGAR